MNLEDFINTERKRLAEERLRLSARSRGSSASSRKDDSKITTSCPTQISLNSNINDGKNKNVQKPSSRNILKNSNKILVSDRKTANETFKANDLKMVKNQISSKMPDNNKSITPPRTPRLKTNLPQTNAHDQNLSSLAIEIDDDEQDSDLSNATFSMCTNENPDNELENAAALSKQLEEDKMSLGNFSTKTYNIEGSQTSLNKATKELANQKQQNVNFNKSEPKNDTNTSPPSQSSKLNLKKHQDDMEQWVTDTFYSYFPGYSNELQNRQHFIQERQAEYQQNFLKHQMLEQSSKQNAVTAAQKRLRQNDASGLIESPSNLNTSRVTYPANTNNNNNNNNASHLTDKTDLEIINVNNPNYEPPKNTPRPGSARHKLLQDLKHTDLANIITGDAVLERNRTNEELAFARKKDYQRELMAQIEEKRRSVELLREKERRQEEALTRRLQEQLKTMQLEEQLEKEKMLAEKIRMETEQNRLMRANMLAKLENDAKNLYKQSKHHPIKVYPEANKENANLKVISSSTSSSDQQQNNKVYQYFSNSARHEYRRGQPLPVGIELELELPEMKRTERECFHLCEKICPFCDEPLKSYETCCLRCQRQLSLKILNKQSNKQNSSELNEPEKEDTVTKNNDHPKSPKAEEKTETKSKAVDISDVANTSHDNGVDDCRSSFALVCHKCERLYTLCPSCMAKSDVCRACHRKRNVCMNCRRTLCTFCLEEIACGRDTERSHINDVIDRKGLPPKHDTSSERSFEVLEVKYSQERESDDIAESPPMPSSSKSFQMQKIYKKNNLTPDNRNEPPFSTNISPNSVFHSDYKLPALKSKEISFDPMLKYNNMETPLKASPLIIEPNLDKVRKETDRRLSRYMKNYADLVRYSSQNSAQSSSRSKSESQSRSTQTTPETTGRRDVVLQDANNLSMPLLREMPKMTRKESNKLVEQTSINNTQRKMDNLKRRFEIPAVQKFSISPNSPRILTQVGAIRKQLQAEYLFDDDHP